MEEEMNVDGISIQRPFRSHTARLVGVYSPDMGHGPRVGSTKDVAKYALNRHVPSRSIYQPQRDFRYSTMPFNNVELEVYAFVGLTDTKLICPDELILHTLHNVFVNIVIQSHTNSLLCSRVYLAVIYFAHCYRPRELTKRSMWPKAKKKTKKPSF